MENPYYANLDAKASEYMVEDTISLHALQHFLTPPIEAPIGKRVSRLQVKRNLVAIRLIRLQDRGIIIYTVEFNPSWDYFRAWVQDVIVNQTEEPGRM